MFLKVCARCRDILFIVCDTLCAAGGPAWTSLEKMTGYCSLKSQNTSHTVPVSRMFFKWQGCSNQLNDDVMEENTLKYIYILYLIPTAIVWELNLN